MSTKRKPPWQHKPHRGMTREEWNRRVRVNVEVDPKTRAELLAQARKGWNKKRIESEYPPERIAALLEAASQNARFTRQL